MPIKQNIFKRYFAFNDGRYEIHAIRTRKANAEKVAESLRRRGFKARVTAFMDAGAPYAIWRRKGG